MPQTENKQWPDTVGKTSIRTMILGTVAGVHCKENIKHEGWK